MIIFIDESGTHKQTGHATIALVYIEAANIIIFENEIENIEKKLNLKYFHWSDERWPTRKKFMKRLLKLDFTVKIAILKNPVKLSRSLEEALKHLVLEQNIRKIIIDGRKAKWYLQKLKKILRDRGTSVRKIMSIRKDESSPGIRVADCLAGLVRYHSDYPEAKDAKELYSKLEETKKIKFELTIF